MWAVEYYTRPNGWQPAREWISAQDNSILPSIHKRIETLEKEGLLLEENGMLVPVVRKRKKDKTVPGFYELKHRGKKWRLAIYHDLRKEKFILLCGWRKSQQRQEGDIAKAYTLLQEYMATKEG